MQIPTTASEREALRKELELRKLIAETETEEMSVARKRHSPPLTACTPSTGV